MSDCNKCRNLFKSALNNEILPEKKELFENHLNTCGDCSKEFNDLIGTVAFIRQHKSYEAGEEFIEDFWLNIEPALKKQKKDRSIAGFAEKIIGYITLKNSWFPQLAGAVTILIIGILLGRYFFIDAGLSKSIINPADKLIDRQSAAIQAKAENYVERSKVLLLGLTNFDPAVDDVNTISLLRQQNISRLLLSDAADLKAELNKPSQANLLQLVSDLEIILMQIANLESEYDLSGIELVKQGVDRRGIFLKINIREMQKDKINSTQPDDNEKELKNNI
jgi:hypothetical protein